MKCPVCGNTIKIFDTNGRAINADFHYVCSVCGTSLKWSASTSLRGALIFFFLYFFLDFVFDLLIKTPRSGVLEFMSVVLPGIVAFGIAHKLMFKLERKS
jgi:hypothetical protein